MARQHWRTECLYVTGTQRVAERTRPSQLAYRVTAARLLAHLIERRVTERPEPESFADGDALGASLRVRTAFERARAAGVDDEHAHIVGDRERLDLERAAIDEECMLRAPEHRRQLILRSARHSG